MNDTRADVTTGGEVVVYEAPDGGPRVEVVVQDETAWLTQRQMADLFGTTVANVSLHARNAFEEGELAEEATIKESLIVRTEGQRQVRRRIRRYNLDVIISVGYRCGFHANPITHSTAIRSAVPRVFDHPQVRPPQR